MRRMVMMMRPTDVLIEATATDVLKFDADDRRTTQLFPTLRACQRSWSIYSTITTTHTSFNYPITTKTIKSD